MSFLSTVRELVSAAAGDLSNIGSNLGTANAAAAASTQGVVAAGPTRCRPPPPTARGFLADLQRVDLHPHRLMGLPRAEHRHTTA
jgi:PE family